MTEILLATGMEDSKACKADNGDTKGIDFDHPMKQKAVPHSLSLCRGEAEKHCS